MLFDPSFPHPETLPGEPVRRFGAAATVGVLLKKALALALAAALCLPLWLIYLALRLRFPRPPIVFSPARALRCARMILGERPAHGPSPAMRAALLLELARRAVQGGALGAAWLLDELLFGRALSQVRIDEPVFEISAARSGSTQLSRYLEDDPHLCAPSVLQECLPFLWLWRLARPLAPFAPDGWTDTLSHRMMPKEHHERHEVDLLRTDTFEMLFLAVFQLGDILMSLGPRALAEDFRFDAVQAASRGVWDDDFLRFIDAIGRKTLLAAGPDPEGQPRRLLIKGHFLLAAPALAQRYPGARFLTVLRAPERRLQSLINFLRCQGTVAPCPPVPWPWLVEYACTAEVAYCDTEMAWFQEGTPGPRRCVVRFEDYLRDLPGTMALVYRQCLDRALPAHVPRVHAARVRSNYSVDRSLAQLGVDAAALAQRLAAYTRWCQGAGPRPHL
jgi:hypothetical protein